MMHGQKNNKSDEDVRFLKCFRPSQHLLCELNVICPVAFHMQRPTPVNNRQDTIGLQYPAQ